MKGGINIINIIIIIRKLMVVVVTIIIIITIIIVIIIIMIIVVIVIVIVIINTTILPGSSWWHCPSGRSLTKRFPGCSFSQPTTFSRIQLCSSQTVLHSTAVPVVRVGNPSSPGAAKHQKKQVNDINDARWSAWTPSDSIAFLERVLSPAATEFPASRPRKKSSGLKPGWSCVCLLFSLALAIHKSK
jgi:hypothetical protein